MDQLPVKILNLILRDLSLSDQIKIRSTCRQWKQLIDLILSEQEEIILFIDSLPHSSFYWNFDKKMINLENSLLVQSKIFMNHEFNKSFHNIKKLYIVTSRGNDEETGFFFICFVNCFKNLKHLQIIFQAYSGGLKFSFNSANLHTLYIKHNEEIGMLNCPNLIEFSTSSPLKFTKSESFAGNLKFLSCKSLEYEKGSNDFKSLETLVLHYCKKIDLKDFPCLKKIFFINHLFIEYFLRLILKQKKQLGRDDLEIFSCSMKYSEDLIPLFEYLRKRTFFEEEHWLIKLIKRKQPLFEMTHTIGRIPSLFDIDYEFLQIYIDNRNKFRSDSIERTAIYSDSMGVKLYELRKSDNEMFEDLSKCFDELVLGYIIKNDILLNIKDAFKYVKIVYLDKFDQNLLDLLPIAFPNVLGVYINPFVLKRYKFINFKFLTHLKNLQGIYFLNENTYPLEDLSDIFEHCKFLNYVDFGNFIVHTYRNSRGAKVFEFSKYNGYNLYNLFIGLNYTNLYNFLFKPEVEYIEEFTSKFSLLKYLEETNLLYHDKSVQIV